MCKEMTVYEVRIVKETDVRLTGKKLTICTGSLKVWQYAHAQGTYYPIYKVPTYVADKFKSGLFVSKRTSLFASKEKK